MLNILQDIICWSRRGNLVHLVIFYCVPESRTIFFKIFKVYKDKILILNLMVSWCIPSKPYPNWKLTYFTHGCEVSYCLPSIYPNLQLCCTSTWFTWIAYCQWWMNLHSISLLMVGSTWPTTSRYVIAITNCSNLIWSRQESKASQKIHIYITWKIYTSFLFSF